MTAFTDDERLLLSRAVSRPDRVVRAVELRHDDVNGASLLPAMARLVVQGMFELRERPVLRYVLTDAGLVVASVFAACSDRRVVS